jgi:hypothetical protein
MAAGEFIPAYDAGSIPFVPTAIMTAGEILQLADGRAAYLVGLKAAAIGDGDRDMGAAGIGKALSASATTFSLGDDVYWDASANLAINAPFGVGDFYLGACAKAKIATELFVLVDLNAASRTKRSLVEAHTADDTLTALESGTTHTTVGAGGTVVLSLPAAVLGLEYSFYVGAAQELRIDPNGTETISLPSTGVPGGAGKYLTANAAGESVHLKCCVAGSWAAFGFTGTWTAEG